MLPVKISTKDRLKAMGINVGLTADTGSLDGSFGDFGSDGGGIDDFNVDDLESDEDLSE